ncbi:hypothetical protein EZI54_19195 [Marinobacter halodurans]|uniref:DUF4296 domain-containing protein n=1 Tax=Marinobacter halodurans TaxID=2528979 RepID=A0ABY1ZHH5_9GAMM|nr:hypothetical protein [Marinobacter halodurans]TBW49839.1 hypothetical protein EZI54_19195 [Marinobacter halodurans]
MTERMRHSSLLLAIALTAVLAGCQTQPTSEAERIGHMVQAVDAAIDRPADPESLDTLVRYGTDSRYYIMIRGWLSQELEGVESQYEASRNPERRQRLQARADFLRQAIRRIDLE